MLFALLVLELLRWWPTRGEGAAALRPPGRLRGGLGGGVPGAARGDRLDRAALQPADRQARAGRRRSDIVAHILSYAAHQTSPHGPHGDRLLPVGLAGRHQADHLPADQPRPPDRRAQPGRAGGALPRADQPADPAARAARAGVRGGRRGVAAPAAVTDEVGIWSGWPGSSAHGCRSWRQPDREPDELPVLHGDRDAGDLPGGGGPDRADRSAAQDRLRRVDGVRLAAAVVLYPFTPLP